MLQAILSSSGFLAKRFVHSKKGRVKICCVLMLLQFASSLIPVKIIYFYRFLSEFSLTDQISLKVGEILLTVS